MDPEASQGGLRRRGARGRPETAPQLDADEDAQEPRHRQARGRAWPKIATPCVFRVAGAHERMRLGGRRGPLPRSGLVSRHFEAKRAPLRLQTVFLGQGPTKEDDLGGWWGGG